MKSFAVILLCAFVAVQARSAADVAKIASGSLASLGENPSIVHLRVATSNNRGLLHSCAGVLISNSYVLTVKSCLNSASFIWLRFGVTNVYQPSLVIEASQVSRHSEADIALINLNKIVEESEYIKVGKIAQPDLLGSGRFCGWGEKEDKSAGENLKCSNLSYLISGDNIEASVSATKHDLGAPLVNEDGSIVGLLSSLEGVFVAPSTYQDWIEKHRL